MCRVSNSIDDTSVRLRPAFADCSHPCPHANVSLPPLVCQMLISKYLISVRRLITLGRDGWGVSLMRRCDVTKIVAELLLAKTQTNGINGISRSVC